MHPFLRAQTGRKSLVFQGSLVKSPISISCNAPCKQNQNRRGQPWNYIHLFILEKKKKKAKPLLHSLVAQMVKNLPALRETWVQSLDREDPLEKGMATHSSILAFT